MMPKMKKSVSRIRGTRTAPEVGLSPLAVNEVGSERACVPPLPVVQIKETTVKQNNITDLYNDEVYRLIGGLRHAAYQASQHAGKARKTQTFQKIADVDFCASYVIPSDGILAFRPKQTYLCPLGSLSH